MRTPTLLLLCSILLPALVPAQRFRRMREDKSTWKKPVRITWQRNLEDALALARAQGRPLLICVNMDGEPASIRFATQKYRDPAFARLCARFVCVIASPNRHTLKDHDEQGRRIVCPKFGGVTCSEHIAIEPGLFERFFAGRRVAPRHLAVTAAGKVLFDRFLDRDLKNVDRALEAHQPQAPAPSLSLDADAATLLQSRDARARKTLEARYLTGDGAARRRLLQAAARCSSEPFELLRLGLHDTNAGLRDLAGRALAQTATKHAVALLLETLDARETGRAPFLAALARLAAKDPAARRALTTRRALTADTPLIPIDEWRRRLGEEERTWPSEGVPDEALDRLDRQLESLERRAKKGDPGGSIHLAIADANFRYAKNRIQNRKDPSFLLADADRAAKQAEKNGAPAWRAAALRARIAHLLGKAEEAGKLAASCVSELCLEEPGAPSTAAVLEIFARSRAARVYAPREHEKDDVPGEAIAQAHRAYQILAAHPFGTEKQALSHLDLLQFLAVSRATGKAIRAALRRWPLSAALHERLRNHLLGLGGPAALEQEYERRKGSAEQAAAMSWFAGYAELIAAEQYLREGHKQLADRAYARSASRFAACAEGNPSFADSAHHYRVLALGGRARLATDAIQPERAVELLLQAAALRPASFSSEDGLGQTPLGTATKLIELCKLSKDEELIARLRQGLAKAGIELQ